MFYGITVSFLAHSYRNLNFKLFSVQALLISCLLVAIGFCFNQINLNRLYLGTAIAAIFAGLGYVVLLKPTGDLERFKRLVLVRFTVCIEIGILVLILFGMPGYIFPLLDSMRANIFFLALSVWQFLGVLKFSRPWKAQNGLNRVISIYLFVALFVMPIILFFVLGPAVNSIFYICNFGKLN